MRKCQVWPTSSKTNVHFITKCIKWNAFKSPSGTCNYDRDSYVRHLKKMKRRVIYDFCSDIQCQKYFNIHSSHKLVCVAVKYLRLQQENNRKPGFFFNQQLINLTALQSFQLEQVTDTITVPWGAHEPNQIKSQQMFFLSYKPLHSWIT